jgi:DNA-binding response OmpR family regulator
MSAAQQEHVLPRRVLVVDDDELARDTVAMLLRAANFEVVSARDGVQALSMASRQWFPVVVTDRNMPGLDGLEFTSRLRALATAPTYVIMLTASNDARDYERGYCAGVDQYLSKQGYEKELVLKVTSGVSAIRRRRASVTMRGDGPVTVDLEGGSHTARHLVGRLCAEMATANQGPLHVLSVAVETSSDGATQPASEALFRAAASAARPKLDWIARLPAGRRAGRLAVVMPQSSPSDVAGVAQATRNAFVQGERLGKEVKLSTGSAQFTPERAMTALELLGESERNRRGADAADNTPAAGGETLANPEAA